MKKKIFLLSTFIVLALGILFSGSKPEVEAVSDSSCETYTIYYMLLDATRAKTFEYIKTNGSAQNGLQYNTSISAWTYGTLKQFNLVPETGAVIDESKSGPVSLSKTGTGGISFSNFFNIYKQLSDQVPLESGNKKWIRATTWFNDQGVVSTGSVTLTDEDEFINNIPTNYGHPEDTMSYVTTSDGKAQISIGRTWYLSEALTNYDDETIVYSPAVYKVVYDICDSSSGGGETEKYEVKVHFCEDGASDCTLANSVSYGNYSVGETMNSNWCPKPLSETSTRFKYPANGSINGILVSDPEKYQYVRGEGLGETVTAKNHDVYCYYTKSETEVVTPTEHTLTVKYGSSEDCSNTIATTVTKPGLVSGDSVSVDAPSIITVSDAKMTYSQVGNVSPTSFSNYSVGNQKLTVTMPDSNVTICLVYTPKTGLSKGWLYLVWAIGLGSLGYSGWYFYRYYKNKKQEI